MYVCIVQYNTIHIYIYVSQYLGLAYNISPAGPLKFIHICMYVLHTPYTTYVHIYITKISAMMYIYNIMYCIVLYVGNY